MTRDTEASVSPDRPAARTRPERTEHVVAITGLLLLVVALWAPFGLRVGPTFEEWKALYWTMERGSVPVVFPNRPLHFLPNALAHLTGRPLEALNLMQSGAILAKGALVYLLVVRLVPGSGPLAFLAGALAIVYPADTGLFTLRTIAQHLAVALALLAIYCLLSLWCRFRWWKLLAIWLAQTLSLSLHAVSIPLLLASPVLLAWEERTVTRRLLLASAAAVVVPVAFATVTLAYGLRHDTYEGQGLAQSGLGPGILGGALQILGRTLAAYARHFSGGWVAAVRQLSPVGADTVLAFSAPALAVGPVLWWLARRGPAPRSAKEARPYLELAFLALCAMPLGFLLFLPTSWIEKNWRVFFISSAAAGVVVAILCGLVAAAAGHWRRPVLVGLGGLLVALGLNVGLGQHRGYAEWAQGQQKILLGIVRTAPQIQPGVAVLLIDSPPYPGVRYWRVCGLVTECLEMSLRYIYGRKDLEAVFCAPDESPRRLSSERCRFEPGGLVVEYRDPWGGRRVVRRYPYQRLLAFETADGTARLLTTLDGHVPTGPAATYAPADRIGRAAMPPAARAMLVP